ncbi:MAG TPA: RNA polymerase sigma factor [Nevskiales bacterium]|nr:RNA polymerase sigma factor [Nevskiales bacterium]
MKFSRLPKDREHPPFTRAGADAVGPVTAMNPSLEVELDAFLAAVERRALRLAEFAVRNRDEALDLVQESMLGFVRRYRQRPQTEWSPLFYRVLQSRIFDWHRRHRRGGWRLFGGEEAVAAMDGCPAGVASDPLHALQRERSMSRLEAALQALPLRQQQVFLLRVWEGLDVSATAQALGLGTGSVKTHLSRALARLRNELGEEWP